MGSQRAKPDRWDLGRALVAAFGVLGAAQARAQAPTPVQAPVNAGAPATQAEEQASGGPATAKDGVTQGTSAAPAPAADPSAPLGQDAGATPTARTPAEQAPAAQAPAAQTPAAQSPAEGASGTPGAPSAAPQATPAGAQSTDQPGAQNAAPQPGAPPPSAASALPIPAYRPGYRSVSEATLWCDALEIAAPDFVRRFDLATTRDGRATPALEIAAPGPLPPAERSTLLVIGALDGRSLVGAEAALAVARELAANARELRPDLCVIVAPFANVEALDVCRRDGRSEGRTLRPVDDDRDGALDEDGPDDVDDDGLILEMLVESPHGTWAFAEDPRWVVPAQPGAGRRFLRVREGRDDDGDGLYNEDGPGGVDLDRNFPVGRVGPWLDTSVGALPLSEPVARALAELTRTRRVFATLLLQGAHGGVATPGGIPAIESWSAADRSLYEHLGARFSQLTARELGPPSALRVARGVDAPGAALDWFAVSCGALALELAPWGAGVERAPASPTTPARFELRDPPGDERWRAQAEREWARWLDEQRDGMGYVAWRPVDLRDGRAVWVGGFEPWTVETPPATSVERALAGLPEFVRELCDGAPRLEFASTALTRSAGVVRVRATLRNLGALPTSLRASAASSLVEPLRVELVLGPEQRLLAGPSAVRLDPLAPGELSRELEWLMLAPAPATLALRARGGWCAALEREVRE